VLLLALFPIICLSELPAWVRKKVTVPICWPSQGTGIAVQPSARKFDADSKLESTLVPNPTHRLSDNVASRCEFRRFSVQSSPYSPPCLFHLFLTSNKEVLRILKYVKRIGARYQRRLDLLWDRQKRFHIWRGYLSAIVLNRIATRRPASETERFHLHLPKVLLYVSGNIKRYSRIRSSRASHLWSLRTSQPLLPLHRRRPLGLNRSDRWRRSLTVGPQLISGFRLWLASDDLGVAASRHLSKVHWP
jgi:hypothetical protein